MEFSEGKNFVKPGEDCDQLFDCLEFFEEDFAEFNVRGRVHELVSIFETLDPSIPECEVCRKPAMLFGTGNDTVSYFLFHFSAGTKKNAPS